MKILVSLLLIFIAFPSQAVFALDRVTLKDGTSYDGRVLEHSLESVRFQKEDGSVLEIPAIEVRDVEQSRTLNRRLMSSNDVIYDLTELSPRFDPYWLMISVTHLIDEIDAPIKGVKLYDRPGQSSSVRVIRTSHHFLESGEVEKPELVLEIYVPNESLLEEDSKEFLLMALFNRFRTAADRHRHKVDQARTENSFLGIKELLMGKKRTLAEDLALKGMDKLSTAAEYLRARFNNFNINDDNDLEKNDITTVSSGFSQLFRNEIHLDSSSVSDFTALSTEGMLTAHNRMIYRGVDLFKEGKYYEALEKFNTVLSDDPYNYDALLNRAYIYIHLERLQEAIDDFSSLISIRNNEAEFYNARGNLYYRSGRLEEALADFDRAVEINPDYLEAYNNRAFIYREQNEYLKASENFSKAIEINPSDPESYNNRGYTLEQMGRLEEAEQDYTVAIRLDSQFADSYNNRGYVRNLLGKYTEAARDFTMVVRLSPDFSEAYHNRALMYYYLGQYRKALNDLDKCMKMGYTVDQEFYAAVQQQLERQP